jgi:hypothetical protein
MMSYDKHLFLFFLCSLFSLTLSCLLKSSCLFITLTLVDGKSESRSGKVIIVLVVLKVRLYAKTTTSSCCCCCWCHVCFSFFVMLGTVSVDERFLLINNGVFGLVKVSSDLITLSSPKKKKMNKYSYHDNDEYMIFFSRVSVF